MPHNLELVPVQTDVQIVTTASLAQEIWSDHYVGIISQAQIDYMLARLQSAAAIAEQLQKGNEYFLLYRDAELVGYAAVKVELSQRRLFISKLYLRRALRRQGLGRAALQHLAALARQRDLPTLWLTVNKRNSALTAYLRVGFVIVADVIIDIGNGYVMDDYQLEWTRF
ncbi:MAG: GNAT family N-acetyltransferase [Steroidobacteraceae bacterium]